MKTFAVETSYLQPVLLLRVRSRITQLEDEVTGCFSGIIDWGYQMVEPEGALLFTYCACSLARWTLWFIPVILPLRLCDNDDLSIDHLHARSKKFVTYDVTSGGAFQATERTEKIGVKRIPIVGHSRASELYCIAPMCVYSGKVYALLSAMAFKAR